MINSSSYRIHHMHIETSYDSMAKQPASPTYQRLMVYFEKRNWLTIFVHAAVWLILYFTPAFVVFVCNAGTGLSSLAPTNMIYLLTFLQIIIFSYLHYYWLTPWLFSQKNIPAYCFLVAVFIALITGLQYLAEAAATLPSVFLPAAGFSFSLLVVSVFSALLIRLQEKVLTGKKEILKMKLSLLNTQINPHFLFNALNWIYLLSLEASKETPEAIIQLSGMMRYVLKEAGADFIDLKKELQYIKNYVALQKGRLGNTVSIDDTIPVYKGTGKIAPLLLMSFIENAFKHGVDPDEDSAISIDISTVGNMLYLQVINNRVFATIKPAAAGIGIYNARQRLQLLYPYTHELEILENNKIYSVKLSIGIL